MTWLPLDIFGEMATSYICHKEPSGQFPAIFVLIKADILSLNIFLLQIPTRTKAQCCHNVKLNAEPKEMLGCRLHFMFMANSKITSLSGVRNNLKVLISNFWIMDIRTIYYMIICWIIRYSFCAPFIKVKHNSYGSKNPEKSRTFWPHETGCPMYPV